MTADLAPEARRGLRIISRWTEPKVGEPAHGFLMRISQEHGISSAAAFADDLGLNDADDAEGCLIALSGSELAEHHMDDLATLRHWTPAFDGSRGVLAGEVIRRDDWTVRTRKYCAACLAEDSYHRTWFDLTFVAVCPFHGTPVTDILPDGTRGYFRTAEIAQTLSGVRVAVPSPRLDQPPKTIESYALGRLGLMPRWTIPFLDVELLGEIIEASEVMGRLAEGGWRHNTPEPIGIGAGAAAATKAIGFAILAQGPEGAKALFRKIAAQAPAGTFGTKRLFGWASPNFAQRRGFCGRLQRLMAKVAVEIGYSARRAATRAETVVAAAMTMAEVAAEVGQTVDVVTAIATDLGVMLPHKGGTGTPFLMPRANVPDVAAALTRSVTRGEAAAMLGVSYDMFLEIARTCSIPKVGSRWGQREDGKKVGYQDRFERDELTRFLDSIPAEPLENFEMRDMPLPWPEPVAIPELLEATRYDVPEFFRGLMAGEIRAERTGRDKGLADFEVWPNLQPLWHPFTKRCLSGMATRGKRASDGMSMREAAALLEVEVFTIRYLIADGHFGGDLEDTGQNRLDRDAVVAFFRRYAVAKVYAEALECTNAQAVHILRKRGLSPAVTVTNPTLAQGKQNLAFFFDRAEVRNALGLALDPEATDGARIVWKRLSAFLGQNQSAFSLSRLKGQSALLSTFSKLWCIDVRYEFDDQPPCEPLWRTYRYSITAQLTIEGKSFGDRRDEILSFIKERTLWPEMQVEVDATGLVARLGTRSIHDGIPIGPTGPAEAGMDFVARYGAEEVDVIERMLHMLKGAFEPSDRPFDLRTFGPWEPVRYRPWADDEHRVEFVQPQSRYRLTA